MPALLTSCVRLECQIHELVGVEEIDGPRSAVDLLGQRLRGDVVEISDGHTRAAGGKESSTRLTDPAGTTGDQCRFTGERHADTPARSSASTRASAASTDSSEIPLVSRAKMTATMVTRDASRR